MRTFWQYQSCYWCWHLFDAFQSENGTINNCISLRINFKLILVFLFPTLFEGTRWRLINFSLKYLYQASKCERSCICVLGVSILFLSAIFLLDFLHVSTVFWFFSSFYYFRCIHVINVILTTTNESTVSVFRLITVEPESSEEQQQWRMFECF